MEPNVGLKKENITEKMDPLWNGLTDIKNSGSKEKGTEQMVLQLNIQMEKNIGILKIYSIRYIIFSPYSKSQSFLENKKGNITLIG
jgi:hypothetical protein